MKIINNVLLKVHRSDIKDGVLEIPVRVEHINCHLYKLKKLKQIIFPSSVTVVDIGITSCNALQELCIPDSVQYLDLDFNLCANLKSVMLPVNIVYLQNLSVIRCASLDQIKLPQSLIHADSICIFENPNLKSVILPKSLQDINELLVACCENIQKFFTHESCSIDTIYVNDNPKIDRCINEKGENSYELFRFFY